jgi:hypothetical protein
MFSRATAVVLLFAAVFLPAHAHPISLTSAQSVVGTNSVDTRIEVMLEDFMLFYGLLPGGDNVLAKKDIEAGIERHKAFLLRDFVLRDADGGRLDGSVVKVSGDPVPDAGVDVGRLMDRNVVYHLRHPLPAPPTHLSFQQTFGSGEIQLPALMELDVRQEGLGLGDTVSLSNGGNVETFEFDWSAGDRAGESPEEAWRRRRRERKTQRMGIESYDAIYGFIYIVDHEVRVEILVPLLTLETWREVKRKNPDFIEPGEQLAARSTLEEFFCRKNKVVIDGVVVKPTLRRLDFYGLRFSDFAVRPEPKRISALTARVGAILSYGTRGRPREVEIVWDYFNAAVFTARTAVYAYDKTIRHPFSPYRPKLSWRNPGTPDLPKITAVDVGEGSKVVTPDRAKAIAGALVRNVYRAFDYRGESDIYDALARSVHGELLSELYLKIRRGLTMQEQGGAVSRVESVQMTGCSLVGDRKKLNSFAADLTWTVEGTVEHWGHIHTRVNQYRAECGVRTVENAWKIDTMRVLDQKQLKYQVRLRTF